MTTRTLALLALGCGSDLPHTGYVAANGLETYYEVRGAGRPLVLLHGAFSNLETDFGRLLPELAAGRQVIGIELQGHGRTADIDRPISYEQLADDVDAVLDQLGVENADFLGYSMGGSVALQVAVRHPERVRKVVHVGGAAYHPDGLYPELLQFEAVMTPQHLAGTPWQKAYAEIAPNPGDWPALVEKIKHLDVAWTGFDPAELRAIAAPTLLVVGDADISRPEHVADLFRLLGGGVMGDLHGLPKSQLAILPGTTHVTAIEKTEWIASMVVPFLDAP
jgi:pimeloyl-ACP methyl ester carboxylesterase